MWRNVKEVNRDALNGNFGAGRLVIGADARRHASLEHRFGPFADLVLGWKAIRIDAQSRDLLLDHIARAMNEAADNALQKASGDYRPDQNASRFPAWQDAPQVVAKLADGSATILWHVGRVGKGGIRSREGVREHARGVHPDGSQAHCVLRV
ncbi:MAG TPA: hypothetical protein VGB82_12165 [Alphaproteobacteria bacterium]